MNAERFKVAVTYTGENGKEAVFYNSQYTGNGLTITGQEITSGTYPNIPKNGDVTLTIQAVNFKLPDTGAYTMVFQYIPRADQSELSISWKQKGENL